MHASRRSVIDVIKVGLLAAAWLTVACNDECPRITDAMRAEYARCQEASSERECADLGGQWVSGLGGVERCSCPTRQDGCPCSSDDDCLDWCTGPQYSGDNGACSISSPTCEPASNWSGCKCAYFPDGKTYDLCMQ